MPRIDNDSHTSISRTDSQITTFSLNARHRSGRVTSFHFHPDRGDGEPHATTLDRRQMGAVEHFSATNNTFQRIEARDAHDDRHRLVRDVNDQERHSSRDYLEARPAAMRLTRIVAPTPSGMRHWIRSLTITLRDISDGIASGGA